ncbi:MAG: hypothetical protein LBC05_01025 [Endomicrobium sp.]|jgi:thiamine-phosphate pyrophosphorylase|nr:hypothetical protein [Endomicrobium sp.]
MSKSVNYTYTDYFKQKNRIKRVIDVNLNRCREGLRVVEDTLRFVLNDEIFCKKIRTIRHNVDRVFREKYVEFIQERNSFDDIGRQFLEISKKELHSLLIANFKRVQESLRVLEEYCKIFNNPIISMHFKKERYAMYMIEKSVYLKYSFLLGKKVKEVIKWD